MLHTVLEGGVYIVTGPPFVLLSLYTDTVPLRFLCMIPYRAAAKIEIRVLEQIRSLHGDGQE